MLALPEAVDVLNAAHDRVRADDGDMVIPIVK